MNLNLQKPINWNKVMRITAGQVSGTVTNTAGETLPGVSVVVKGTTNGTLTDVNGYLTYESTLRGFVSGATYSRDPDAIIPLSQKAIENSFKDGKLTLKQNPGY